MENSTWRRVGDVRICLVRSNKDLGMFQEARGVEDGWMPFAGFWFGGNPVLLGRIYPECPLLSYFKLGGRLECHHY